eukprot:TRINITY_DN9832_c0_g1_i2.p1 TRINITY_DN9832_c0_g1~~TRINITY_DN9832_c0_g1_i2.p1  ORF type:complete len:239 (-),score=45.47 TRINITY_DN9832_c0_g1_i2:118-834(-)
MENATKQFSAVILGGSGAVGRELVDLLLKSPRWKEVSVIVRRKIDRWVTLEKENPELYRKLKIVQVDNLDTLENTDAWKFENYDSMFCCLGTKVKQGDEIFYKVDFKYPVWGGQIAINNKIPHYALVTTIGADSSSKLLYYRTKGQVEEALKKLNIPTLSILRPGLIDDRDNDWRFLERFFTYVPFIPKIKAPHLADALRREAERVLDKGVPASPTSVTYVNAEIKKVFPELRQQHHT